MLLTEWRTCQQPARRPIGGKFLMGKLATCEVIFKCFRRIEISYSQLHLFVSLLFATVGLTRGQNVQTYTSWMVSLGQKLTFGFMITLMKLDAVSQKGCQKNMRTVTKRMFGVHLMAKDWACATRVSTWLEYIEEIVTSYTVLRSLCVAGWKVIKTGKYRTASSPLLLFKQSALFNVRSLFFQLE